MSMNKLLCTFIEMTNKELQLTGEEVVKLIKSNHFEKLLVLYRYILKFGREHEFTIKSDFDLALLNCSSIENTIETISMSHLE